MDETQGLMTKGSISKQLLFFSIPLLLGNLFQQLYNTMDSIVVGNFIGGNALAAVGASTPIINLLVGLFMGIATGAGVVIARFFGARDAKSVQDAVHTSFALTLIAGGALTVAGVILSPALLKAIGTPAEVLESAVIYLRIYFLGVLVVMLYNIASGILRAVGDSKNPLYFLIVSSVLNILLDLLFVAVFQMGVAGVAWATLIAQAVSAVLVLALMMRSKGMIRLEIRKIRMSRFMFSEILRMGLPGGVQNAIVAFSNVIVQANINSFGAAAMAGCSSYSKIDGFAILPIMSFSMAITTFTGQNIGAKNFDRVKKGAKTCLFMSLAVSVVLSLSLLVFGKYIFRVFSPDEEILSYATMMCRFLVPGYLFLAITHTYCGVVRGAGVAMVPMLALVGNMCVLRMLWIWLAMPAFHSIIVVYLGYTLTWMTSALTMVLYYKKGNWLHRYG